MKLLSAFLILFLSVVHTWGQTGQGQDRAKQFLEQLPAADTDGDGVLSREEFQTFRKEQKANAGPQLRSPMKRYTTAELATAYEARELHGLPYRFLQPPGYEDHPGTSYPLILSLHGAGGKGSDNKKNLKVWMGVIAEPKFQAKHPCFVVAPQSPGPWRTPGGVPELSEEMIAGYPEIWQRVLSMRLGIGEDSGDGKLQFVFDLLDSLAEEYRIDLDRVYVLGHSMGGFGSFEALAMQPKRFAAAIPSAGGLAPWHDPQSFDHVPIWAFHGTQDTTVPAALTELVFEQMKELEGRMKYTSLGGVGHGANGFAFIYSGDSMNEHFQTHVSSEECDQTEDVWDWLFAQKRNSN